MFRLKTESSKSKLLKKKKKKSKHFPGSLISQTWEEFEREQQRAHPDANSCKPELSSLLQGVGNKVLQCQLRSIEMRQGISFSLSCCLGIWDSVHFPQNSGQMRVMLLLIQQVSCPMVVQCTSSQNENQAQLVLRTTTSDAVPSLGSVGVHGCTLYGSEWILRPFLYVNYRRAWTCSCRAASSYKCNGVWVPFLVPPSFLSWLLARTPCSLISPLASQPSLNMLLLLYRHLSLTLHWIWWFLCSTWLIWAAQQWEQSLEVSPAVGDAELPKEIPGIAL